MRRTRQRLQGRGAHVHPWVANLGSTSFKYALFDMATERELARGGVERIGFRRRAAS